MGNKFVLVCLAELLIAMSIWACGGGSVPPTPTQSAVPADSVKVNPHPTSLEGKTVVLRWNGKPNGDKFLSRVGELLAEKTKEIKVIKLWETDPGTAAISKTAENSAAVADGIAALKPDLVIGSQCD